MKREPNLSNLDLAKCEQERNFLAVTAPFSPRSVELHYPVMESSECPCRCNKVTDLQSISEKSLWQWPEKGRDFAKFSFKDKDELNLRIQKHMAENGCSTELIIENLEQCTEDHNCNRMIGGHASENQCHEETEFEETEHKLLAGGMFFTDLHSQGNHPAPVINEKCDVEKENNEKDGAEEDYHDKDGEEMDENEITNKVGDEKEADDTEKNENEETEKEINKMDSGKRFRDEVETIEYGSKADVVSGETVIDSGFFETELLTENSEDGQLWFIDRSEVVETQIGLEVEEFASSRVQEPIQMEMKEQSALVLTLDSIPEDLSFEAEMSGNVDSLMPDFLTIKSFDLSVNRVAIEEEMSVSCMGSDAIRHEISQKQLDGVLIATGAEMVPSNIQPIPFSQNTEQRWKNISNFTIKWIGTEFIESLNSTEQCRVRSGDRSGKSSQGNCGNGGGSRGSQTAACGSNSEGCLSMVGNPSSAGSGSGCGGGGDDEDGDKWKKENFQFSDSRDEKRTKQEKELKKKSRLEKGDLCSYAIVSYGNEEKLRIMAHEWGERSEYLRNNTSYARHHSEGVILVSHQNEFSINKDAYQEGTDWAKSIHDLSPLGHGTSGKCYPCADIKTGKIFCVKEIQLSNFYDSEIAILLELDNPGIVKLYGAIFSDDKVYILLELIRGPTLQEEIDNNKKLDCITALEFMRQLLELLDYLEKCGVIHDDVKADNIMLREDSNSIVLIDFGLAKKALHVQKGTLPFGSQCGMSPEKAASEGYNGKADVWAATAVLVHMISGNTPWTVRFRNKAHLYFIIKEKSPPLEDVPPNTPAIIKSIIETGWIVDVHRRPSASQLLETFLPSDELLHEFNLIDEHTALESFNLEEGEKLIMEAEEMLLSANLETGTINHGGETLDHCDGATSYNGPSLRGLMYLIIHLSHEKEYSDQKKE